MFVELDRPPPPERMAEGAYWLFMPIGIGLTTPGLASFLAILWGSPFAPFSFGGAAYVAAWYAAGLQRALGWGGGFIVAVATMFALGLTFLGVLYLVLAYRIVADVRADGFILGDGNDLAIALPLLASPVLAGVMLAANALA